MIHSKVFISLFLIAISLFQIHCLQIKTIDNPSLVLAAEQIVSYVPNTCLQPGPIVPIDHESFVSSLDILVNQVEHR